MESWVPCKFPPGIIIGAALIYRVPVVGSLQIPPWYNLYWSDRHPPTGRGFPANSPLV